MNLSPQEVASLRAAGHELRRIRRQVYGMTLEDVTRAARDHFGEESRIDKCAISRLENGKVEPTMRVICQLGSLYSISPNDLAALFGFPHCTHSRMERSA
jgi:transcriptional regulator with XRE-family HTH domain